MRDLRLSNTTHEKVNLIVNNQCYMGLSNHGMERPPVADGGDGLQKRRVAENILNKKSRTADNGWSPKLEGWVMG
jgi:hypothetical protein